ncbi:endonuclease/Exonuclease/phosphatase [Diaporthe amygdali]|uniref:endonuclease/Exonuclease/phosphatase n=1 Tax=Phomopsis amygdali TaxID=1214568 RepID=UPI0022FF33E3|nr:endonuclease/Exonuclease/phosphatase [Diaporthe amygdali]KAJ0117755.1 endonuclease/Exonuclease/phosphatase [Diaporthe amygdali]
MGVHDLEKTIPLRIITFNVRYATTSPTPHEELWKVRRPKLGTQLRFNTVGRSAFISFQEALANQVEDIQEELGSTWAHIGVGRDDGKSAGEFSPVFYQIDTWKCERSQTYWLSPTPEEPSTGWDAVLPRIVTMGQFEHRENGARVVVLSTHFDHIGLKAREESAKLILKLTDSWVGEFNKSGKGKPPVYLGGDFNSTPEDKAYQTMTAPGTGMTDISTTVPEDRRYGNVLTYTSFNEPDQSPSRIDFLFVKDTSDINFLTFGVLANRFDDGVFISDHRAVVADMEIPVKGQRPSM